MKQLCAYAALLISCCALAMDREQLSSDDILVKNAIETLVTRYQNVIHAAHTRKAKALEKMKRKSIQFDHADQYLEHMESADKAECAAMSTFKEKTTISYGCRKEKSLRLPTDKETPQEYFATLSKKEIKALAKKLSKNTICRVTPSDQ